MKHRGREHTSLTETATIVVSELTKIPGIKMIAPGEIRSARRSTSTRYVTAIFTNGGFELLISGQSIQKVAVHTNMDPEQIFKQLTQSKRLSSFVCKSRERKPGI